MSFQRHDQRLQDDHRFYYRFDRTFHTRQISIATCCNKSTLRYTRGLILHLWIRSRSLQLCLGLLFLPSEWNVKIIYPWIYKKKEKKRKTTQGKYRKHSRIVSIPLTNGALDPQILHLTDRSESWASLRAPDNRTLPFTCSAAVMLMAVCHTTCRIPLGVAVRTGESGAQPAPFPHPHTNLLL